MNIYSKEEALMIALGTVTIIFVSIIVALIFWNLKIQSDNDAWKEKYYESQKKWCDFNSIYIPETALKRI